MTGRERVKIERDRERFLITNQQRIITDKIKLFRSSGNMFLNI